MRAGLLPLWLHPTHPRLPKDTPKKAHLAPPTLMRKMRAGLLPLWLPVASVQLLMSAPDRCTISRTLEPEGPAGGGGGGMGTVPVVSLSRRVSTAREMQAWSDRNATGAYITHGMVCVIGLRTCELTADKALI
jgi:hypothetical protein